MLLNEAQDHFGLILVRERRQLLGKRPVTPIEAGEKVTRCKNSWSEECLINPFSIASLIAQQLDEHDDSAGQIARLNELTRDLPETDKAMRSGSDGTMELSIPMNGNDIHRDRWPSADCGSAQILW
jgi:hypothetical protein